MSTEEEEALLKRARAGDAEPLLKAWEPRIYRFGLRMCGDEDSAREVLQETLLAAFRGLHQFRGDAALSTWLYSLARSFCIRQRRTRTTDPLGSDDHEDEAPRPDSVAHARELGLVLQAALLSLSDDHREVVVLKDVEGLSAEEIARVLQEDVAAVKIRLHRARSELRERLRAVLEPGGPVQACPELVEEIAAFAGGEIDRPACLAIEAHLERCPKCSAACDALKRTVSLCKQLPGGEVPASIRAAVRRALSQP